MTGLLYESIWVRILGLSYGNTTLAVSAVVSAFMAGLALGSYWMGSSAQRFRRPLRVYGIIELGIGLYCAASPALLMWARSLYITIYRSAQPDVSWTTLLQFGLSAAVILVPTVLMGATLPVLSAGLVRSMGGVTRTVGRLYAVNTFGAVGGAFLAGFVALPAIGARATLLTGATVNVIIGLLVWAIDRRLEVRESRRAEAGPSGAPVPAPAADPPPASVIAYLLVGFFLTGLAAMICEVGWTRMLAMVIGSSIYGFAIILTAFLLGLGLGSFVFSVIYARRRVAIEVFGGASALIGLASLAVAAVFPFLPFLFLGLFAGFSYLPLWTLEAIEFVVIFALVAVPTVLMGTTFPIAARICTDRLGLVSAAVGKSYAANTAGCILGSALTGLVLIPSIGVRTSLMAASALYVGVGCIGLLLGSARSTLHSPRSTSIRWGLIAAPMAALMAVVGMVLLPPWSRAALISGIYRTTSGTENAVATGLARIRGQGIDILYYREGSVGTVSVTDYGRGHIALAVNGKVDASTGPIDMYTQRLLAHLPMLLAGGPENVLVIGLGSGATAGSTLLYPSVRRVDCVEIEPAVVPAAGFFGRINHGFSHDRRFHLTIADGRSVMEASTREYDVIISEPSNPWIAGVSNLFSRENYEACKRVLAPGGVMCQWVQGYSLDFDTFTLALATFARSFPHVSLWFSSTVDFLLIGSQQPLRIDLSQLEAMIASNPEVKADLDPFAVGSGGGIASCFLLGDEAVRRITQGSEIHTDNHPLLEFRAPMGLYQDVGDKNFEEVWRRREALGPLHEDEFSVAQGVPWIFLGMAEGYLYKDLYAPAVSAARSAIALAPEQAPAYVVLGRALWAQREILGAVDAFRRALQIDEGYAPAHYSYGRLLDSQGATEEAVRELRRAIQLAPEREEYKKALDDLSRRR